ncbi:alpha-L-fucosidase [Parabacteroides caecihominis]|jgi:alpha-L-fucosidase|uniref:alpha-L-fucosidase n=2 Tax=unclassified Parabacteroides TaxID=2649774 RepID=UPI00202F51CB|nr:alpha-L-fucosidase [Parabacteroides sp. TA-V-105]MCM0711966.1 alpha-L-fucosidase [Parabacteroides sp. TA-V-105]
MMNKLILFFFLLISGSLFAKTQSSHIISYDEKMTWWRNAKFGLFVHWGPYALYGGVYNGFKQHRGDPAWIMNRCKIPFREYRAKAHTFNPVKFNADALVNMAKEAGMKYVVFTTKHHDGFAMFKSNASNFNIIDYTHFNRDIGVGDKNGNLRMKSFIT